MPTTPKLIPVRKALQQLVSIIKAKPILGMLPTNLDADLEFALGARFGMTVRFERADASMILSLDLHPDFSQLPLTIGRYKITVGTCAMQQGLVAAYNAHQLCAEVLELATILQAAADIMPLVDIGTEARK